MADLLAQLAEARIREWQRRRAAGEPETSSPFPPTDTWENQMFQEILALRRQARAEPDRAAALRARAESARLQLVIALERDQPLLARALDAELAARDREAEPG